MRWWNEFCTPSLKCERLGHTFVVRKLKGYARPYKILNGLGFGVVAYGITANLPVCSRCGRQDKTKVEIVGEPYSIQSLGLLTENWDVLERTGYFLE